MTDPKRSPIAALAKKWRDAAAKARKEYADLTQMTNVPASTFRSLMLEEADYHAQAAELEAAIAAQVEVFERNEGVTCRTECIQLLKGEP